MLKSLYIKNFTLIDELDIELYPGFSVITGETGAGKSIILGAIALLLGQRADSKSIKQGADKCVIEAHFDLTRYDMDAFFSDNDIENDATDCIVRRELLASGKSRAFINDTPVQLSMLKELGERLVDVHSQHQNLLLNKQDFQLGVVDIFADDATQLSQYQKTYKEYHQVKQQLDDLRESIERNRQNADFLRFQCDELTQARLVEGEQEELEQQSDTMSHSEDIKSALYEADNALTAEQTGIVTALHTTLYELRKIGEVYQRVDSCYIELKDIAQEVSSHLERIDFDPAEMDAVNNRLDKLYDLEKKYHVETVEELIAKRDELCQQLNNIDNSDEALSDLEQQLSRLQTQAEQEAGILTALRTKAARKIEAEMQTKLVPLGMPNVRFSVDITREALSLSGQDKVAFLFSANTSTPLQPISQVASGGEIARVMLSLKAMISGAVKLPTIIFDEIDTGVSGKMAEKMAEMMQEMGAHGRQVISITHLPQIAALGSTHYKVEKSETAQGTVSSMHQLTPDERIHEIAQMLSGSDVSDAAIANAKELLKIK